MIRVILVDDEELFRSGLSDWLGTLHEVEVLGEATSAEECLELLQSQLPDIVLVDIRLPGVSGVTLIEKIRETRPGVKTLVLSGSSNPDLVFHAFEAGANGFLPKQVSSEELSGAMQQVLNGRWYLSPLVTADVLSASLQLRERLRTEEEGTPDFNPLTGRERELLKLIAEGHTFTEIGTHLSLNSRSVERLKSKLEAKLHASNLSDLIREAIRLGLVDA